MHAAFVARRARLSALVALAVLAGTLFVAAPKASAALADCPANAVCAWEGRNFNGQVSWWPDWDWGCHNHIWNPEIRSWANNTGYWVRFGGAGIHPPYSAYALPSGYIHGLICWPE